MKHIKKITAVLLVVLLMVSILPCSALAAAANTPKEEVVYINLNTDGSVKEIVVVNIFDLNESGQIIDYGKYESLQNMTTTDKIHYTDDTITIDAKKAGRLYYEGRLSSNVMPWNISIRYFLDGKEYSGSEIAGKSGDLKIAMKIEDNPSCIGSFFEGYALQASLTLDTNKCTGITAEGATVANVGSNKQLTYTILPGKGADVEITAKVTDFEMSAIAINGVKLNLSIEIDDSKLKEKIDQITGAVGEVDNGAGDLNEGAKELYDGTTKLADKGDDLKDGVNALYKGSSDLASGLDKLSTNNQALVDGAYSGFRGLCLTSETILNARLSEYGLDTVTLTPDTYHDVLTELLNMFGYSDEAPQSESEAKPADILSEAIASLLELRTNLDNYRTFYNGIISYTSGVSEAATGANTLKTNLNTLNKNADTLKEAFDDLNEGAKKLYDGTTDLKDGTTEFANETDDIEAKVSAEIENMVTAATGSDVEVASFVSKQNSKVNAVQFVIRTEAIAITEEALTQQVVQENLTFWQKLLRLFGL